MYTRLQDLPVFAFRDSTLDAQYFNHVQTALHRIGPEIRLSIPKLKHLDLILQEDAWIIVDRVLNDMAIAAWTDFPHHRDSLHEDIACRLQLYHQHAPLILKQTLDQMDTIICDELALLAAQEDHRVIPFQARGK